MGINSGGFAPGNTGGGGGGNVTGVAVVSPLSVDNTDPDVPVISLPYYYHQEILDDSIHGVAGLLINVNRTDANPAEYDPNAWFSFSSTGNPTIYGKLYYPDFGTGTIYDLYVKPFGFASGDVFVKGYDSLTTFDWLDILTVIANEQVARGVYNGEFVYTSLHADSVFLGEYTFNSFDATAEINRTRQGPGGVLVLGEDSELDFTELQENASLTLGDDSHVLYATIAVGAVVTIAAGVTVSDLTVGAGLTVNITEDSVGATYVSNLKAENGKKLFPVYGDSFHGIPDLIIYGQYPDTGIDVLFNASFNFNGSKGTMYFDASNLEIKNVSIADADNEENTFIACATDIAQWALIFTAVYNAAIKGSNILSLIQDFDGTQTIHDSSICAGANFHIGTSVELQGFHLFTQQEVIIPDNFSQIVTGSVFDDYSTVVVDGGVLTINTHDLNFDITIANGWEADLGDVASFAGTLLVESDGSGNEIDEMTNSLLRKYRILYKAGGGLSRATIPFNSMMTSTTLGNAGKDFWDIRFIDIDTPVIDFVAIYT